MRRTREMTDREIEWALRALDDEALDIIRRLVGYLAARRKSPAAE